MAHDTHSVKRRLSVEQNAVAVVHVSLHRVSYLQLMGYFASVAKLKEPERMRTVRLERSPFDYKHNEIERSPFDYKHNKR